MIDTHSRATRLALTALGLSIVLCAIALVRVLLVDPLASASGENLRTAPITATSFVTAPDSGPVTDALPANDPFDPDRASLRLEPSSDAPVRVTDIPPATVSVRLLGTVLLPNGASFAVCQLPSAIPRSVRVGDSIGGLTVVSIERGHVVLHTARGDKTEIDIVHPGG